MNSLTQIRKELEWYKGKGKIKIKIQNKKPGLWLRVGWIDR